MANINPSNQSDIFAIIETSYGPLKTFAQDSGCCKTIQLYGDYSPLEMAIMSAYVNSDSVVVDVGANIGAFTVPLAQKAKKVYAIEPQVEVFEVLKDNIALNNLNNVEAINCAVGHHRQPGYYTPNPFGPGIVRIESEGPVGVDVIPLDDLDFAPDFIKIDVESMEAQVLGGGIRTIMNHRPVMFIEGSMESKEVLYILSMLKYCACPMSLPVYTPNNKNNCYTNYHVNTAHLMLLATPQEYHQQ
jgi:FkbM family methyltransferase